MKTILVAVALVLVATGGAQAQTVSGAQITAEWADKTAHGKLPDGRPISMRLGKDGRVNLSGTFNDTGTWRPTDTGYCTTYRNIRNGAEACFNVEKAGDKFVVTNKNGSLGGTFTEIK